MAIYRYPNSKKDSYMIQLFHVKEEALEKVSKRAYKELIFEIKKEIRAGNFERGIFEDNIYKVPLSVDPILKQVYGNFEAFFIIDHENRTFQYLKIEPEEFLMRVHKQALPIYKGIPYRDAKDKFKIDLAIRQNDNKTR